MEQLKEVEDVVDDFVANMRYITWRPIQLARHLGDAGFTGPRGWCRGAYYAPLDVAQAVADFAAFIAERPLPHVPHRHRQGATVREEVVALGAVLHGYMDVVQLTPTQLAYHCHCSPHAVRGWWRGWSSPPTYLLEPLHQWARYIREHPFPQYRKGTHGGPRYQHAGKVTENPLHK
jgi:hypothetical protein